jgi:hypothetical protein
VSEWLWYQEGAHGVDIETGTWFKRWRHGTEGIRGYEARDQEDIQVEVWCG